MTTTATRQFSQFTGPEVGLTKPYRYHVLELPSLGRVQLWFKAPSDTRWHFGHGKDIPAGQTFADVADAMRRFVTGELSHGEYNALLPE